MKKTEDVQRRASEIKCSMSLKIVKTKNRNLHLLKETSELEPPVVFLIHEIVENKSHRRQLTLKTKSTASKQEANSVFKPFK